MSEPSGEIQAPPGAIRQFLYRVNSDNEFRESFLDNPDGALKLYNIMVDADTMNEIMSCLHDLKERYPDVYLAPIGWGDHPWELLKSGEGILIKGSDRVIIT